MSEDESNNSEEEEVEETEAQQLQQQQQPQQQPPAPKKKPAPRKASPRKRAPPKRQPRKKADSGDDEDVSGSSSSDDSDSDVKPSRKRAPPKKKKEKDKDAPKRAQSAYILYGRAMQIPVREELKAKDPDIAQKQIMSEIARRWNKLSKEEKKPYEDEAAKDKVRYEKELAEYRAKKGSDFSDEEIEKKPRKRYKRDPNAPRPRRSGYLIFQEQCRDEVRNELKLKEGFKNQDVMVEMGKRWKALSDNDRKRYNELAEADKERYEREMAVYNNKE